MRNVKTAAIACAIAGAVALAGSRAEARLIDLHAGATAGGMTGWGTTTKTPDFFDHGKGGGVGFDVGLKLLIFDFSVNFFQTFDSHGAAATLTQFLLGTEVDLPVGNATLPNGQTRSIVRPGFAAGFGLGTPAPVSLPLTDSQLSHKGIVSEFKLAYEYFLNPFIGVGVEGDFGYHYFFGGMVGNASANDHSSGYHVIGLGTFTFHLGY